MENHLFLQHLKSLPRYEDQIVHIEHISPSRAIHGELETSLCDTLMSTLKTLQLLPLYRHQAEAINTIKSGSNLMVATPSASGKTLCYNLPVLDEIFCHSQSRALYLFPTKSLAQDQLRSLEQIIAVSRAEISCSTFDGDTPYDQRTQIKRSTHILLSNPDMLHLGILPNHRQWSQFFGHLKYVIIDEAHVYRGVFGSHMANLIRRLRRLCDHYGSHPQFILCSATIDNPKDHSEKLTGLSCTVVDRDGSPHGSKDFVFWNPPLISNTKALRRSANIEATFIASELLCHGIRTLTFARTRRLAELICLYIQKSLAEVDPDIPAKIRPYRAGYLAEDRRIIEQDLFQGRLLGTVSTNALELGIDIGSINATVLTGYPGSVSSTWQQAGRSGRRQETSISFLVGIDNPLDQYFMQHPEAFFEKSFENALTNSANPHILEPHLLCAAWELPLRSEDMTFFDKGFLEAVEKLTESGALRKKIRRWHLSPQIDYPSGEVNLRSSSTDHYLLVDESKENVLLETIDDATAFFQVHQGAVYLHQGQSYMVNRLDIVNRIAYATPTSVPYYTQTRDITDVSICNQLKSKTTGKVVVYLGEVEVTTHVLGFKKKRIMSEEVISEEPLQLPPIVFHTVGLWFDLPSEMNFTLSDMELDYAGGLHAVEHIAISLLPLFALCDRNDIGGMSTTMHTNTGKSQVFIYDAYPGGIGIAEKGFELIEQLWEASYQAVESCPCQTGCPGCIQSPKCGNNNQPLDKEAAKVILRTLLT